LSERYSAIKHKQQSQLRSAKHRARLVVACTVVLGVGGPLDEAAGAEVDEVEALCVEVDDEVLVLDVSVYDPYLVHGDERVDNVAKPLTAC